MTTRKTAAIVVGLVLVAVGFVLFMITEPAGTSGSPASGGIANVSEETRPYLIPAVVVILLGVVVFLATAVGKM